ncbi:MAG: hypothetical protein E4H01_04970 [Lysobacterales bacterium]|nr:MAG: hypothetical protein E4H01_04970 [Xanthomonadales bacterium]
MNIVGISGKAGSGKDFLAKTVFAPAGFKSWSLAWHFKVWLAGQGQATYEEVFHTKPPHVRDLLQQEGTERGRNVYGENIWCDTAAMWITLLHEVWGADRFVIPDIRFPNEVAMVQRLGGKVIRLCAPERVATSSLLAEARAHPSETALDNYMDFDLIVFNDPGDTPLEEQCAPILRWACGDGDDLVSPFEQVCLDEVAQTNYERTLYK